MNRRRLLIANRHSNTTQDSPDYIIDYGEDEGVFKHLEDDRAVEAYNRVVNGEKIRVRVITVDGTFEFYDFEEERRNVTSYKCDVIEGSRSPQHLAIYQYGEFELYMG